MNMDMNMDMSKHIFEVGQHVHNGAGMNGVVVSKDSLKLNKSQTYKVKWNDGSTKVYFGMKSCCKVFASEE